MSLTVRQPDSLAGDSAPFVTVECGSVPHEAESVTPSLRGGRDLEKMARRRYQAPTPRREGNFWWLFYRQDEFVDGKLIRKFKRAKLAPASMSKREVEKIAAEYLRPLNQGLVTIGSAVSFAEYVNGTYKPTVLPLMAKATQGRYAGILENYLLPTFGKLSLRDMAPLTLQRYFTEMVNSPLSFESKDKIRDVLSSVLGSAKGYGFLVTNPAEGIRLPRNKQGRMTKPYVDPTTFAALLGLIREPYATMAYVAIYTGLRVSELIGLQWRNVHADSISIEQRCCRGDWGAPKSESSSATIAVNENVIKQLNRLKTLIVEVKAGTGTRRYPAVRLFDPDRCEITTSCHGTSSPQAGLWVCRGPTGGASEHHMRHGSNWPARTSRTRTRRCVIHVRAQLWISTNSLFQNRSAKR